MTHTPPDWPTLMQMLTRHLEALERGGVRWLNLAQDEALRDMLVQAETQPVLHEGLAELAQHRGTEVGERPPEPPPPPEPDSPLRQDAGQDAAPRMPEPRETLQPVAPPPEERPPPREAPAPVAPREDQAQVTPPPSGPPPHPSSLATLESLRFQYRDCQGCGLAETRNRLVFGTGSHRPRLMFIGEGPGADEDAQGLPFVGRAGRLLTGLIQALGLLREDVYITNVVKCRPPGNRNPEPEEIAACRPILQRQIELLAPALIVTLGNVPLKLLRPDAAGITRERGKVFDYQGFPVLPTFHPSYLLRNQAAIETCWEDFRQALERAYPGD